MFENRRWLIIPTSLTGSINFSEVHESGLESLRISNDGSITFVKYDVYIRENEERMVFVNPETQIQDTVILQSGIYGRPSFYSSEYPEHTYQEIIEILSTSEWIQDKPELP